MVEELPPVFVPDYCRPGLSLGNAEKHDLVAQHVLVVEVGGFGNLSSLPRHLIMYRQILIGPEDPNIFSGPATKYEQISDICNLLEIVCSLEFRNISGGSVQQHVSCLFPRIPLGSLVVGPGLSVGGEDLAVSGVPPHRPPHPQLVPDVTSSTSAKH